MDWIKKHQESEESKLEIEDQQQVDTVVSIVPISFSSSIVLVVAIFVLQQFLDC